VATFFDSVAGNDATNEMGGNEEHKTGFHV
jgi:hypothetical protein